MKKMRTTRIRKRAGHPTRHPKAEIEPPIIWSRTALRLHRLEELLVSTLVEVRAVQREVEAVINRVRGRAALMGPTSFGPAE